MRRFYYTLVTVWLAFQSLFSPSPVFTSLDPTPTPSLQATAGYLVRLHPDGGLFVGDQVSIEVFSPAPSGKQPAPDLNHHKIEVQVDGPEGSKLGPVEFGQGGQNGQFLATFLWAWDTSKLEPGSHTLTFSIAPDNVTWSETVYLGAQSGVPPPEPEAQWAVVTTPCCVINYLTQTAAARDIDQVTAMVNEEAASVANQFHTQISDPIKITFLPRLLGHGGFTSNDIYVSYLDRDYAGGTVRQVLHHEMVHFVDAKLGGELRPDLLVEGLATYLSGGHFKLDPLSSDTAALIDMGWYVPLSNLADRFYPAQHEIGYLEAGAFIGYLVQTWGWDGFSNFYRDIHPQADHRQSTAIDAAAMVHFGLSFTQLEDRFIQSLTSQAVIPDIRTDVVSSVRFYETMRRYQQMMDPSANFRAVWLPNSDEMRKRGIVADFIRHPDTPENQAIETLLIEAENDLRNGRFDAMDRILGAVETVLNRQEANNPQTFSSDPITDQQITIVRLIDRCGLDPQTIDVQDGSGSAQAISTWPMLVKVPFIQRNGMWQLEYGCTGQ